MEVVPRSLATRLSAVIPSVTLAVNAKANALRAKGVDVFGFGVGEPDFDPPPFVLEAAKKAIDSGAHKYTPVTGIAPLKRAICDDHQRRRGQTVKPENVCVSVGAKHALFNVAMALYDEGDDVVLPTPCWVSYPEQVRLVGANPVLVPTREEDDWLVSPDALERALTARTKAVVLCTPSNPTGAAYDEAHMREVAAVLRKHDCWIIVDEIYSELVYGGFRHVSVAEHRAGSRGSHGHHRRGVEDVRDDRVAHRVGHRARAAHQGARPRAGPEHDERNGDCAARGRRGAHRPARRRRDHAGEVRAQARRHGDGVEQHPGRSLPHARGRFLRVRRLPRPLRPRARRQGHRERRRRRLLPARERARRRGARRGLRRAWVRTIQLRHERATYRSRHRVDASGDRRREAVTARRFEALASLVAAVLLALAGSVLWRQAPPEPAPATPVTVAWRCAPGSSPCVVVAVAVRCTRCHDAPHAKIDKGVVGHETLGCVVCHGGDGAATARGAAHVGLLSGGVEARCALCHVDTIVSKPAHARATYQADALARGRMFFRDYRCGACHVARDGSPSATPLETLGLRGTTSQIVAGLETHGAFRVLDLHLDAAARQSVAARLRGLETPAAATALHPPRERPR